MHFFFFGMLLFGGRGFFLRFRLRGKQRVRLYITTHVWIPAELHGACSEHSKSLSWLSCQGVAFRLAELSRCIGKPHIFGCFQIARSALTPAIQHHQSDFALCLPSLLSATQQQQQHSSVIATDDVPVCMCVRFCMCESACYPRHTKRSRRAVGF